MPFPNLLSQISKSILKSQFPFLELFLALQQTLRVATVHGEQSTAETQQRLELQLQRMQRELEQAKRELDVVYGVME